jgi:hypothetical protein
MTSPESRAKSALENYIQKVGSPQQIAQLDVLKKCIAEAVIKAVTEDRDELREKLPCDKQEPCGVDNVCSRHKALAGAFLGVGIPR